MRWLDRSSQPARTAHELATDCRTATCARQARSVPSHCHSSCDRTNPMVVVVDLIERVLKTACSGCDYLMHKLSGRVGTDTNTNGQLRASVADYAAQSVGLIRYFSPVARLLYACAAASV